MIFDSCDLCSRRDHRKNFNRRDKKLSREKNDQRTFDRSRFDHGRKYRCDVKAQSLGKQNDQSVTTDNHTLIS